MHRTEQDGAGAVHCKAWADGVTQARYDLFAVRTTLTHGHESLQEAVRPNEQALVARPDLRQRHLPVHGHAQHVPPHQDLYGRGVVRQG